MGKYHFIIIGSGWRSLYYVRIAKAMPDILCLDAMYCRTQEKADKMAEEFGIHTTTSIEECVGYKPDFAVVAVNKTSICDVSIEWMDRGITVLSETPAALDMDSLKSYTDIICQMIKQIRSRLLLNNTGNIHIIKHGLSLLIVVYLAISVV